MGQTTSQVPDTCEAGMNTIAKAMKMEKKPQNKDPQKAGQNSWPDWADYMLN